FLERLSLMRMNTDISAMMTVDPTWRIAVVASSYYKEAIDALVAGATETLMAAGIPEGHISVHRVAGSFEVPLIGSALAKAKRIDALIGLGIIVEGQTHHARLLAEES